MTGAMALLYPPRRRDRACPSSDVAAQTRHAGPRAGAAYRGPPNVRPTWKEQRVLWLIIGIVLLIIAIAGGVIIHPILFVVAILALLAFFAGRR
jgi:hypothetical protein